jgi:O-acetylserine/cysteine efflux transporter
MPLSHFGLVLLVCLAWGGNFLAAAVALQQIPPFLFTALRLGVVLVCLLAWLRPIPRDQIGLVAAVSLLNGALHFGLNFWALRLAGDISSTAIALQSYIPMSALLAVWLLGERIPRRVIAGIVIAFCGVLILGFDPLVLDAPAALAVTLVAAFTLALGTTLMRRMRGVGTFELQAWGAVIGIPFLLLASWLFESGQQAALSGADWRAWAGAAYSGLIASLVGHGLLYWLVQRHPVSLITPYLLIAPVFAIVLGVLVWGDHPGPGLIVGGAMVLAGVLAISTRALPRRRQIA